MTAALGLGISAPTFAAAPTFTGVLTCTDADTGEVRALETVTSATRHDIAVWRKFWNQSGFCANGSLDTSGLTQDP
jgi:hypothetical protein